MSDDATRLHMLMTLIGSVNMVDPKSLPHRVGHRVEMLARRLLYVQTSAEELEAQGKESSMRRGEVLATALALRVMLRPEVRSILLEESARDDNWSN